MLTVQFPPDLPAGKNKQAHGWFSDMAMKIKKTPHRRAGPPYRTGRLTGCRCLFSYSRELDNITNTGAVDLKNPCPILYFH